MNSRDTGSFVVMATVVSGGIIAYQVAGKATRDALFLSSFPVTALPSVVIGSAALSVLAVLLASRLLATRDPTRVIPEVLGLSGLLLLVEWGLVGYSRQVIAIVVYLHFSALGALLISGFWSIVSERFDPRTAKKQIGRIAAGGTLGGVLGGVLAERVGASLSVTAMLPLLAGIQFGSAWVLSAVRPVAPLLPAAAAAGSSPDGSGAPRSGLRLLTETPYLMNLVSLVLLATVSEGLIDYVFKANAVAGYGRGEDLIRLFAAYYTGIALLTFLVQTTLSRHALESLGLAKTVATLPAVVAAGAAGSLMFPGLASALLARGGEAVCRSSLYRSAYELLFTPIPAREKRATKALVDVGIVRLGDVLGAGVVQVALLLGPVRVNPVLMMLTISLALAAMVVARRLHAGYLHTLEKSLLSRAVALDVADVADSTTRTAFLHTTGALGLNRLEYTAALAEGHPIPLAPDRTEVPEHAAARDPVLARIIELRSGDPVRVRRALPASELLPLSAVPQVIPLLAWDEVAGEAMRALRAVAPKVSGQLLDALLDPEEEFAVRRRIPLVLEECATERVVDGLLAGLEDRRFEVRYRCGRTLTRLQEIGSGLGIDREKVLAAVLREVTVDRQVWHSQRLLDRLEDAGHSPPVGDYLRDRASRSLGHVFTMLSLVLPRTPLQVALRGLYTDDAILRGTALEYLESALPDPIREKLWPFLEDRRTRDRPPRPREEILADLMRSNESIAINLQALQGRASGPSPQ